MYRYYYQVFNKLWSENELIAMDTDSFFMNIKTEDVYEDMEKNIKTVKDDDDIKDNKKVYLKTEDGYIDMEKIVHHFDTSEYPKDSKLYSKDYEKVIGKWKDEVNGNLITDIIFLKSKVYTYKTEQTEVKKLKGCSKATRNKNLCFNEYDEVLNSTEEIFKKQYQIHSKKHEIFFEEINKKILSSFDDKRYLVNSVKTIPHCDEETKKDLIKLLLKNKDGKQSTTKNMYSL